MPRNPRYILPNSLQHVVDVVHQNRYLLCPSEELNQCFLSVLRRAQKKYDMTICAAVVLSSHYHLLLRPWDGQHLAAFMCFFKTILAKAIGHRLRGLRGHFFAHRYHASMVSEEESAQVQVLRYILSHGVKENLVDTVRQWPGVHSAAALIDGTSMTSDHCKPTGSRGAPDGTIVPTSTDIGVDDGHGDELDGVVLAPLPCWQHQSEHSQRQAVRDLVADIDHQAAVERRATGKASLGVAAVLAQDPFYSPDEVEASPQPHFHAVDDNVLASLVEAWRHVLAAYALASAALRSGDRHARFPEGTFPPALPFVPFSDPTSDPAVGVLGARGQPA